MELKEMYKNGGKAIKKAVQYGGMSAVGLMMMGQNAIGGERDVSSDSDKICVQSIRDGYKPELILLRGDKTPENFAKSFGEENVEKFFAVAGIGLDANASTKVPIYQNMF